MVSDSIKVFQLYPEQRRITADEVDKTVLSAVTMKTSEQRAILENRHAGVVMRQDIYNLQRKLGVGNGSGGRDDEKCEDIIKNVIANGGHGEVGKDENGDFVFVAFLTAKMKSVLSKYPECLIMDSTYKVNNYLYPLLTIMVIDCEGHGIPVFHAFLAKEDVRIMAKCLSVFAEQVDVNNVHCFIVDKNMSEIAAIGTVFPTVHVNLCQFHISQAVERYLRKELGRGTSVIRVVRDTFMSQVTTESESEFEELKLKICQIVPQSVIDYFTENWWSKKNMWAACVNVNVIRLHATTTNTLESYHSKIKKIINEKLSLSNVLAALICYDEAKITEQQRVEIIKSNSDVYDHRDRDTVFQEITKTLSRFGAELVKQELALSRQIQYTLSEGPAQHFSISYRERTHVTTSTTCTCSTFGHFNVPCRHIFFVRNHINVDLFDANHIPDRFKQIPVRFDVPSSVVPEVRLSTVPSVPLSLTTVEGRFKHAKLVCDKVVNFLSILGVSEFRHKLQELEEFISRWSGVSVDDSSGRSEDDNVSEVPPVSDSVVDAVSGSSEVLSIVDSRHYSVSAHNDDTSDVPHTVIVNSDALSSHEGRPLSGSVVVDSERGVVHGAVDFHCVGSQIPVDTNSVNCISGPSFSFSGSVVDSESAGNNENFEHVLDGTDTIADTNPVRWPKMKKLLKPRGRPCTKQKFTKLSAKSGQKRRRNIPSGFADLSDTKKINLLLQSVCIHKVQPHSLVTCSELKDFVDFSDTVLDEKVDLSIVQPLFEASAWQVLMDGVAARISDNVFYCGQCNMMDDGEFKMIQCEHCLKWHHFHCVNYSSKKKVHMWFCELCM